MQGWGPKDHLLPSEELTSVHFPQSSILAEPRHIILNVLRKITMPSALDQKSPAPKARKKYQWLQDILTTLGLSILIATGLKLFVVEARFIPSGSMEPNLEAGDHVLIDKVSHHLSAPKRGELFVFLPPRVLQRQGVQDALIKRVVGLPGEQITLMSGHIHINGRSLSEPYLSRPGQTNIPKCPISDVESPYLEQPRRIPPQHYFFLGDNRRSSSDSRCWGVVGQESLVGRAFVRFWPLHRFSIIR